MIPPEFDYTRVSSVDEAIRALGEGGEDAKLLAGGHSLLPLMKLRLAAPTLLVDIGGIGELRGVERSNGGYRIGALTRHADLQDREELGVLVAAAGKIADQQVRNRGTIGGSLAHGDPASDLPGVVLALDGELRRPGPNGERDDRRGRHVRGLPDHGARARRGDHLDHGLRSRRLELRLREVRPPLRGLGDGRGSPRCSRSRAGASATPAWA